MHTVQNFLFLRWALLVMASITFSYTATSQKLLEVRGEYNMVLRKDITMNELERLCIEQARLRCIERECGLRVSESTVSQVKDNGGKVSDSFNALSSTQVQGEWVADVTAPIVRWNCNAANPGELEVTAIVHGKVRPQNESNQTSIFFKACLPCKPANYIETFKNGQSLEAIFKAGNDGYLSVFYMDHTAKMAQRILPDAGMSASDWVEVRADEEYHLFSHQAPKGMQQSLIVEIPGNETMVQDELIVVFATQKYNKPMMSKPATGELPTIPTEELQRWLTKLAGVNSTFVKKSMAIPITR